LRLRHEDALSHPYDRGAAELLCDAVGALLNHLDGLHADEVQVHLIADELARGVEKLAPLAEPE
jgi:hypothetical protein